MKWKKIRCRIRSNELKYISTTCIAEANHERSTRDATAPNRNGDHIQNVDQFLADYEDEGEGFGDVEDGDEDDGNEENHEEEVEDADESEDEISSRRRLWVKTHPEMSTAIKALLESLEVLNEQQVTKCCTFEMMPPKKGKTRTNYFL